VEDSHLTAGMTVKEAMFRYPEIVSVFIQYRMACVGCAMSPFDTLDDAAQNYDLDWDGFLNTLRARVADVSGST
jgi:hybrid cluster-associated redox disulfide protein